MANSYIDLRSDNTAGVADRVMAALASATEGSAAAYGADDWTTRLTAVVRTVFEHPTAAVFPVSTGTAANALSLAALCHPWSSVLCHDTAHVVVNECGATSMFSGGAVLHGLPGAGFTLSPESVSQYLQEVGWGDPHRSQPAALSLTQPTDYGTLYTPAEIGALTAVARAYTMRVHLDGARLANALAALNVSPADLTWRAGVDVLSLGATKNGAMNVDAIVSFDPTASEELIYRTKRAGQVASKMRFQSAQLLAYLTDGLWLQLAARANVAMQRLAQGLARLGVQTLNPPQVNMLFVTLPEPVIARLEAEGLLFYRMGAGVIRLVTSFQTTNAELDQAIAIVGGALRVEPNT